MIDYMNNCYLIPNICLSMQKYAKKMFHTQDDKGTLNSLQFYV